MANYISQVTLPSGASYNVRELFPHVGNCTDAAATAAKTVTIGNFKLYTGAWVVVKFSNTNSAAVASLTLNVDGTGAKPIKYRNANLSSAGLLIANRYTYFVYDGTNYQIVGDFDTNSDTYDRNRYRANIKAGTSALVAANIIVGKDGVFNHLKSGGAFDISYPILYLNAAVAASATTTDTYDILHITITTTQSITLTAYKPVFIKGTLSGTIFTPVSTTPLTQTVPTTDDGYVYIYLGNATSTTTMYLQERHPIYAFKNNAFGEIVHTASNVNGYTIAKSVPSNAVFTDRYVNTASFADDSTNTAASPVKMTLTRAGSDTATVTANIPKVSSTSAGVAPKGTTVSSQSQSTKFLREDGSWAAPTYTSIPSGNVTGTGLTADKVILGNGNSTIKTSGKGITDNSSATAITSTDTNLITARTLYYAGYLPLSGGTMTGKLTAKASQYPDEYDGALNMNNSNIYGVNSIYTADVSDNAAEGIHFYRDSTHVDTLWMNGGSLLFVPNRELGTFTTAANSQKVARFTANPTTGQVVITDGTTGGVKSSGYTIATSVPSGAVFTDTKNTAGSTDTSSKIFLIGATSQAANPQTYSQDTAYVGTDGHVYSNSKQVVNLSDTQALTNKTYNGYTLAAACAKAVVTSIDTSASLPTSNAVKTFVEGKGYVTTDTKNTAGSTDTSSKIYLIGATSQAANPQTYSDNEVYTTSGVLTTKKVQVGGGSCTMEYNSTTQSLDFIFT